MCLPSLVFQNHEGLNVNKRITALYFMECGIRQLSSFFHVVETLILANNT